MNGLTLWNWDKKQRTMLRYIKAGDIFCFQYNENTYCFGRILSRLSIGTPAEIFNYVSDSPTITKEVIENTGRMFYPINLDIYTLFDRKLMGEWRIIGKQSCFKPTNTNDIFFTYGIAPCKKMDIYGNETIITKEEAKSIQDFGFMNDFHIKELVKSRINKEYIDPFQSKLNENSSTDTQERIKPFILSESKDSVSLLLDVGSYKNHLFQEHCLDCSGNGYEWTSLAKAFLNKNLPQIKDYIHFDSEADMFCARSENKKAITEFAVAFHTMCEDERLMKELLAHADLD